MKVFIPGMCVRVSGAGEHPFSIGDLLSVQEYFGPESIDQTVRCEKRRGGFFMTCNVPVECLVYDPEDVGFSVETALNLGFEILDDDCEFFKCTEEQLYIFAKGYAFKARGAGYELRLRSEYHEG